MSVKYYEWKCGNDIQTKITNRSYGTEQIHCLFSIDEMFLWNRDPKKINRNFARNKKIIYVLHHLQMRCSSGTKIRKTIPIKNLHYNKNIIYVLHHLYTRCSSGTKIRKIIPIKNLHYNKNNNFCLFHFNVYCSMGTSRL